MKKVLLFVLTATLVLTLGACKSEEAKLMDDMIDAIGEVTLDSEAAIKEAEDAFANLTPEIQKEVDGGKKLLEARKTYEDLENLPKVEDAKAKIAAIGEVSLNSKAAVEAAKGAYDSIDDEYKSQVDNYSVFETANAKYQELKKADDAKRREAAKAALLKLSSTYDKVQGITWYEPTCMPKYIDTRAFFIPYLAVSGSSSTLRVKANYTGDDWIFWESLTIMVDGKRYYKTVNSRDRLRDNEGGLVWETGDYVASSSDIEMLRAIANSKEAIVRFQGDNYHYDHTIPAKDKTGIAQVLAAYVE